MRDFELTIVIERDEDGRFLAVCPALQGCYTEGESEEEARELIADAIRLHIESRLERGEPIPNEVATEKVIQSPHSGHGNSERRMRMQNRETGGAFFILHSHSAF